MHSDIEAQFRNAEVADPDRSTRTVSLDARESESILDAIQSGTARDILAILGTESMNTAMIADFVGTSVQNTKYHLNNLSQAGLVAVVGSRYSTKGVEMDVYTAAVDEIDLFIPAEDTAIDQSDRSTNSGFATN
jgi:predicted transcriptional regulator